MDFIYLISDWLSGKLGFPVMEVLGLILALLVVVIKICLFIPGKQPEAFLQKIVDLLAKLSIKPKDPQA